jgi:hypothetical protein
MKDYSNILTQKQKSFICALHYKEGTLDEEMYYRELMLTNKKLRKVYFSVLKESCKIFKIPYKKGETIHEIDYEFDYEEFDELMLHFMASLDEKLKVGLYD